MKRLNWITIEDFMFLIEQGSDLLTLCLLFQNHKVKLDHLTCYFVT